MLAFNAPIEITRSGRIVYESRLVSLTPSGRELDFEAVCYSPSAVTR